MSEQDYQVRIVTAKALGYTLKLSIFARSHSSTGIEDYDIIAPDGDVLSYAYVHRHENPDAIFSLNCIAEDIRERFGIDLITWA